jgi:hypothetical protein
MQEYAVIPSFPDYEIDVRGNIRHKGTDNHVDQYLGRANFNEEKHPRVRLRRNNFPIANSVEELLHETYPHLIPKEDEPAPVVVKKKAPKRYGKRKSIRKPAGRAKPYVDDLGPEWKTIPGFQRYKINREGQVINRRTKALLTLRSSNKNSPNYSLLDNAGETKARHPERLLQLAFKDYEPKNLRKSAVYAPAGEWAIIPNRTKYEIHKDGTVRRTSRHRVQTFEDDNGFPYVKLKTDGVSGFKNYYVTDLLIEVYGTNTQHSEAA